MKRAFSKRIIPIFTAAALLTAMLSLMSFSAAAAEEQPQKGTISMDRAFCEQYAGAIAAISQGIYDHQEEIRIDSFLIPKQDDVFLNRLFTAATFPHPELFYLGDRYGCRYITKRGVTYYYSIIPTYKYNDDLEERKEKFYAAADHFLSLLSDDMTDFEKALVLHDELALNSYYFLNGETYDLMVDGRGKCYGYSEAYAYLLSEAGIDSEIIISKELNHQWNKVCIDGTYYHVDVTWDDPTVDRPGLVEHNNFLISDQKIQSTEMGDYRHYDFSTDFPSDTRLDNCLFHDFGAKICYANGALYGLSNNENSPYFQKIVRYDVQTDTAEPIHSFSCWWRTEGGRWYDGYSGLDYNGGYLYYNTPAEIYAVSIEDGEEEYFAGSSYSQSYYGLRIVDNTVYASLADSPNSERTVVRIDECLPPLDPPDPPLPELLPGDVNADGELTVYDVTYIQRFLAEDEALADNQIAAADYNGDGEVNILDASDLQIALAEADIDSAVTD